MMIIFIDFYYFFLIFLLTFFIFPYFFWNTNLFKYFLFLEIYRREIFQNFFGEKFCFLRPEHVFFSFVVDKMKKRARIVRGAENVKS